MPHRVQHCAQRKMSRGCGWNSHGGRRGPDEGGKDDGASANVRKVAFASEGPFRCTHCGFDRPTSLFTNATERAMVDERRWGAAAVRVMRQPRGRRVGKGLRSGSRAGNVATVRVMRRSRGERGSCAGNVTVRGQRVSVRWAREDMRAQQREGERESMGRFAFVARLRTGGGQGVEMLVSSSRHVASCRRNVSRETFSKW